MEKTTKKTAFQGVSISRGNDKMGLVPSFSFPPVITCSNCAECSSRCYALRMCKRRKTTAEAWARNLAIWQENPEAVKAAVINSAILSGYFRFFVGGDMPNGEFLRIMCECATVCKNTKFLAFTKKYDIVNAFLDDGGKIPDNLQIVFSGWGDNVRPVNPYNLPESDVIFNGQEIPKNAKICGGNCVECIHAGVACWELKHGEKIYFHEH